MKILETSSTNIEIQYVIGPVAVDGTISPEQFITINNFDTESDILVFDTTSNADARVTTQADLIVTTKAKSYSMTVTHVYTTESRNLQRFFDLGYAVSSMTIVNTLSGVKTSYLNGRCTETTQPNISGSAIGNLSFKFVFSNKIDSVF